MMFSRREFLHRLSFLAGSSLLAPLLKACAPTDQSEKPATSTAVTAKPAAVEVTAAPASVVQHTSPITEEAVQPTRPIEEVEQSGEMAIEAAPDADLAVVILVKNDDRYMGVLKAIELLAPASVAGKHVLFKPNLNSADSAPGSTHIDVIRAIIKSLYELGAAGITLADRSGMGNTREVMSQKGLISLSQEMGFTLSVLDELGEEDWVMVEAAGSHWSAGFPVPKMLQEAEFVVQTCNLKTHQYGGHFTMSLKNSVGFVAKQTRPGGYNFMNELHSSANQRAMIAEVNTAYAPDFVILDAVEAFTDGGPATGKTVRPGLILAGKDRVALDAVGVAILRMYGTTPEVSRGRIFEQQQIARAVELGLGVDSPDKISLIGADEESVSFGELVREILTA